MKPAADFPAYLAAQGLAPSTVDVYARVLARVPVDEDPLDWLQRVVTRSTAKSTAIVLRSAVQHWLAWQGRQVNPGEIKLAARGRQQTYRDALNDEELAAYTRCIDESDIPDPVYTVLLLLPWTALRIAEACSLREDAVSRTSGRTGVKVVGKGNKLRWVPLSRKALDILDAYEANRESDSEWLFPGDGDASLSPATVRRYLRELRPRMPGYATQVTPHVLRHTALSRLGDAGVPLTTIQAIAGHSSVSTTARYMHPSMEAMAEAMDKLDKDKE